MYLYARIIVSGTVVLIRALALQNWLEGGVSENNACGKETIEHCRGDLNCAGSLISIVTSFSSAHLVGYKV
jgi:hypothetical protein